MYALMRVVSFGILLLMASTGVSIAASAAPAASPLFHSVTTTASTNWGGFAATGPKGSVSDVKGSWIVPSIHGTCPSSKAEYSSFWVGIDGFNSNSVEQSGTDSDCQGGSPSYYAWYEFFPHPSFVISSLSISPGDVMFAEVKHTSTGFHLTLTDVTTGHTFTKSSTVKAARSSAEWIAEAPSSIGGVLPLADFGSVSFGMDYTNVTSTCVATISGTTGAIGSFAHVDSITMINNAGTMDKATPSSLTSDNSSFTVSWVSTGP